MSAAWRIRNAAAASALLVVASLCVGLLLSEAGYRAYLVGRYPQHFTRPDPGGSFAAYSVSHWEFDEEFGYVYPPERIIDYTGVKDGHVKDCGRINVINRYGNIGPIIGDYGTADLKMLVFGDSWTAFSQHGRTWPHLLQDMLAKRLGKKVHVVNFGRDGYGILQMFDLAAAKIPEWKPDAVLFAFISDDLTRARSWRTVVGAGEGVRVLTTTDPVRNPDPARAADTFLLMPSATYEWCRSASGSRRVDPLLDRLIEKHRRLQEHNGRGNGTLADLLAPEHSYLYDRIVHRDALHTLRRRAAPSVNPRVAFQRFADDPRFMGAVERINATRIPWALLHLAFYPEIKANQEFILNPQEALLLESLRAATGKTILRTTDHVGLPVPQPERLNVSPDNFHPSPWGMEFYAGVAAEALARNEVVR